MCFILWHLSLACFNLWISFTFMELSFFWKITDIVSWASQWWPWLNTAPEIFFIQAIVIYLSFLIFTYGSIYYALLYIFFDFFFIGLLLSVLQLELFTAFLWLIECTVIFIFLVLLFYVNVKSSKLNHNNGFKNINLVLCVFFLFFCSFFNSSDVEFAYILDLGLFSFWDDFYEALHNLIMNDLFGFAISYYWVNSAEFFLVGFLLLVGSVLCVTLYRYNKNIRTQNYSNFLGLFDFFNDFVSFSFLRRQNLVKQGNAIAAVKLFNR